MRATFLAALTAAALSAGCVPVAEPVGDIEKAEPDEALLGEWVKDGHETLKVTIDAPVVKGNPKGLMRATAARNPDEPVWFFVTELGKYSYLSVVFTPDGPLESPKFDTVGGYAAWGKGSGKRYFVYRYTLACDTLAVYDADKSAVEKLMAAEKIGLRQGGWFYATPPGWLAKYLDKNGPDTIFDGSNGVKCSRPKKK